MNLKISYLLLPVLVVLISCSGAGTDCFHHPATAPLYKLVDAEFDAENALKTVGYVEQFWRLAGNRGFDKSIRYVEEQLKKAGFKEETGVEISDRLTYRIERRPLRQPTWEPVSGSLSIVGGEELLNFSTNRNLMAINSFSTNGTEEYEVVYLNTENGAPIFDKDVAGKVVFAETAVGFLFNEAVVRHHAKGVIAYRMPEYLQPEKNRTSIQFSRIPLDSEQQSWGILLSYEAREKLLAALKNNSARIAVNLETEIFESEEQTLVAELKGRAYPDERFVFSAHVQEPGANDNASGVGALAEVAATAARLLKAGKINPDRTITFLFGDEIISTNRFVTDNPERAKNIKWGVSMDMVGEDTEKTGGTFLIEKMPDPAAIWTRGDEKHSEWGGRPMTKEEMVPHYLNDFILNRFLEQGAAKNWEVRVNPFEGGSDHTPFIRNGIPGLLLWHFTDQFYHTDNDRLDKVSPATLKNVGTGALISALVLTGNQSNAFDLILDETLAAAIRRLQTEFELSKAEILSGGNIEVETDILSTWASWYASALRKTTDILTAKTPETENRINIAVEKVTAEKERLIDNLNQLR